MNAPSGETSVHDPHADSPLLTAGPALQRAAGTLVLVHGRGGTAEDILALYDELGTPELAAVAPQAVRNTWYPQSFLAPIEANQPYLDSAVRRLASLVEGLLAQGVSSDRIAILGFSQGACLTSEFVARNPRRYGAMMGLTGGLIGPPGKLRGYSGSLDGTPVLLASGDPDPHVPFIRVEETASILRNMGAVVDLRRYPGMPHTINSDELEACRALLGRMISGSEGAQQ